MSPQRGLALRRERIPRHRLALGELFLDRQISRLLELAQLRTQVAVGFAEQLAQAREAQGLGRAEQHQRPEPRAVLEQWVQLLEPGIGELVLSVDLAQGDYSCTD